MLHYNVATKEGETHADVCDIDGILLLSSADEDCNLNVAKQLNYGWASLDFAAHASHLGVVEWLVNEGNASEIRLPVTTTEPCRCTKPPRKVTLVWLDGL